jgi:hypothetical protein
MLSEVRKEAYLLRFKGSEKTKNNEDEDDEHDEGTTTTIAGPEAWRNWYPQEWVGWVMFGPPADKPTAHWVNMPISSGPTDVPGYYLDSKGVKAAKRPPGRTSQRERVTMDSIVKKQRTTELTMRAKQISLQDEELEMTRSARDLAVIERLTKNADTQEKKVSLTRFA